MTKKVCKQKCFLRGLDTPMHTMVYNESLYYCNSFLLEQISYLGKFWFLRYGPKCSWPIRLQDFSINRRTLKLAVSHKEINGINWFLVCHSNSFLRNGPLGFSNFWHNGRVVKYWKTNRVIFPWKFIFGPKLGKRAPNGSKIGLLEFFEKLCDVFLEIIYNKN